MTLIVGGTRPAMSGVALAAQQPATQVPQPSVGYAPGQSAKLSGFIISRTGNNLLVRDENTQHISLVTLTDATKIWSPKGMLKADKKGQDESTLIAGLKVTVKGSGGSRGELVADQISFRGSAQRVASQVAAGEVELKAFQNRTDSLANANRDSIASATDRARDSLAAISARVRDSVNDLYARIGDLDRYDVKGSGTVTFALGSSRLSPAAKSALDSLVASTAGLDGIVFEVTGFTDATGSAALNHELSADRARAVIAYLTSAQGVPLRRIATPVGYGEANPIASNDTADGRGMNRRVEIRVLMNRGIRPR